MLLTLSAEHLAAAREWLAKRPELTRTQGEALHARGAVFDCEAYKRGIGFRARVNGDTGTFDTKVRYSDRSWEGTCSCRITVNCMHCVALTLFVIAQDQPHAMTEPTEALKASASTFREELEKRLARSLNAEEERMARAVDTIYRNSTAAEGFEPTLLEPIVGKIPAAATRQNLKLWDQQPDSAWQSWLYLAHFLERSAQRIPLTFREVTDWAEVGAAVASQERRQSTARWTEWLARADQKQRGDSAGRAVMLRARISRRTLQMEWRKTDAEPFAAMKESTFTQLMSEGYSGRLTMDDGSAAVWRAFHTGFDAKPERLLTEPDSARILNWLLRQPIARTHVVGIGGLPLKFDERELSWSVEEPDSEPGDYRFRLVFHDGMPAPPPIATLEGDPTLYISDDAVFRAPPLGGLAPSNGAIVIPEAALETSEGVALLDRIKVAPPERIASRLRVLRPKVVFRCELWRDPWKTSERLLVAVRAESEPGVVYDQYTRDGWQRRESRREGTREILRYDRTGQDLVPELVDVLKLSWNAADQQWQRNVSKNFAQLFSEWIEDLPPEIEVHLDEELATLRDAPITAHVRLEVEEAGIDWFDLRVALDVKDTTLTPQEIKALLHARGGFVRLGSKGWKRLRFQLSAEDEEQLADLGLDARDLSDAKQRLHALQLAGRSAATRLLPADQASAIERRVEDIRTRVSPDLPPGIQASLRPYQVAGFHFLAYLTANRFGGILADDMGLGKTLQTLTWLQWSRLQPGFSGHPSIVVCPKSVVDNWRAEAERFVPGLRVRILSRGELTRDDLQDARKSNDLIVLNYAQLRMLEKDLGAVAWHAAILDEAQAIKNPEAQTARAAWGLKSAFRLALSGTPIENRLLDLWSIMAFAMPGVLGNRATFSKSFDQRSDPLARRRLTARVRPFVLRRTKREVAQDLPPRIEEDMLCELEGTQATLYRAELKRARAALLKITTQAQLDQQRFNVLTSLLRLRQICCHPSLIRDKEARQENAESSVESAKLTALLELLEPLIEEGHKVLVFSQFTGMLDLIRAEILRREWRQFLLTGQTEDRGPLVADFQSCEGAAVFLISLRAGGFGLNLTSASYVVLFDPWWNPAVENQAIDRTHRIGQVNKVIAYRLLVKDSIEEKIRNLQRQKSSLAADILGEENFTRALNLDDFRFLLGQE